MERYRAPSREDLLGWLSRGGIPHRLASEWGLGQPSAILENGLKVQWDEPSSMWSMSMICPARADVTEEPMPAKQVFNKALLLLDRGQMERGEACLREALSLAESEPDQPSLAGALCALGELLLMQGRREEAVPFLERVAGLERDDDLIAYEQSRARELLREVTGAGKE